MLKGCEVNADPVIFRTGVSTAAFHGNRESVGRFSGWRSMNQEVGCA